MQNPFDPNSSWYPFRWFLIFIAVLTMSMSYVDYAGWRFPGYGGNRGPVGGGYYYGSHYYHK
jgi:hypothetical protein